MILNKLARDFYSLLITTDAGEDEPASGWEVSFDGGETWLLGEETTPGQVRWLVHGPDFDPVGVSVAPSTLIATGVTPLLRLVDNPTVDIERGPSIILVT